MAFASLGFGSLHFRDTGRRDGPAIVFVNSLGTDMRIWDGVVERLAADYRIVTFDKRGHGLSSVPDGPYSIDGLAKDVLDLADHLDLATFALVGVSVGGMIALRLAIDHPERLLAVVACDTAAKIGDADTWNGRIDIVRTSGMAALADAVLLRWFPESIRGGRAEEIERWRDLLLLTPAEGYASTCAALRDADLTDELASIAVPTLVVVGDVDQSTPVALVRETAVRIPGARFEIIDQAGHIPSIDRPAQLAALIGKHLEAVHG
jgi:3-oxoadipate enol-lactonase